MTTHLPFSSSLKVSITNLFHLECGFHIITDIFSIIRFKTSAVQAIETNSLLGTPSICVMLNDPDSAQIELRSHILI